MDLPTFSNTRSIDSLRREITAGFRNDREKRRVQYQNSYLRLLGSSENAGVQLAQETLRMPLKRLLHPLSHQVLYFHWYMYIMFPRNPGCLSGQPSRHVGNNDHALASYSSQQKSRSRSSVIQTYFLSLGTLNGVETARRDASGPAKATTTLTPADGDPDAGHVGSNFYSAAVYDSKQEVKEMSFE